MLSVVLRALSGRDDGGPIGTLVGLMSDSKRHRCWLSQRRGTLHRHFRRGHVTTITLACSVTHDMILRYLAPIPIRTSTAACSRSRYLLSNARNMTSASTDQHASRLYDDKPAFIYGTAWKKDQTKGLVKEALAQGFRRVDTAAQPRHYQEPLVGEALREAFAEGTLERDELYVCRVEIESLDTHASQLQTKYTTPAGQDLSNMPYDPDAPLDTQIHTSVASSLKNLRYNDSDNVSYVDCLLLHSPLPTIDQTLQAWKLL